MKGATLGDTERYILMCTCTVCNTKMVKTFTKKAYHTGVVILICDGCGNNHLIADNLGWFRDDPINLEEIAKESGREFVKLYNTPKIQKVLENVKFVGEKHTATVKSDYEERMLQIGQIIENEEDDKDDK